MEKENLKKILKDAAIDRNRQLSRWIYHIAKHPEEYNAYIELKDKLDQEKQELAKQMKEHIKQKIIKKNNQNIIKNIMNKIKKSSKKKPVIIHVKNTTQSTEKKN